MFTVLFVDKDRFWTEMYPERSDALLEASKHYGPAFVFGYGKLIAQSLERIELED